MVRLEAKYKLKFDVFCHLQNLKKFGKQTFCAISNLRKKQLEFCFLSNYFFIQLCTCQSFSSFLWMVSIRKLICLTSPICYFDLPFVFGLLVYAYQCVRVFLHLYVRTDVFTSNQFFLETEKTLVCPKTGKKYPKFSFLQFLKTFVISFCWK